MKEKNIYWCPLISFRCGRHCECNGALGLLLRTRPCAKSCAHIHSCSHF